MMEREFHQLEFNKLGTRGRWKEKYMLNSPNRISVC